MYFVLLSGDEKSNTYGAAVTANGFLTFFESVTDTPVLQQLSVAPVICIN